MTGKDKCEFLKEIRKNMAKENGLSYEPRECHHEGYCTGTCPLCEKEAAELLEELKKKEKNGENIQIDSEAIQVLEQIAERPEEIDNEEEEIELLGDIPPGYFEAHPLSEKERELEEQRLVREEAERQMRIKVSQKSGIWNKIKKKIRDCFTPTIMGEFYDEDEVREYTQDDETPFMGIIVHERMMPKELEPEPEPEPEPDIVWNLDGEEELIISPSANLRNDKDSSIEKNNDDYVENLSFFVSHHKNKTIYVKTKNGNESTIIIVREIDGEQIVYDSRYSIEHITWLDYCNDAIEITEEEFESIYNKQTDIEEYVSRKVACNDTFYISMTAEDGMEIFEFEGRKYKRSVGTVIDEGIVKGKCDDVDLDFVVLWAKRRGGACNILSKSDFEEWWEKGK